MSNNEKFISAGIKVFITEVFLSFFLSFFGLHDLRPREAVADGSAAVAAAAV